MFRNLTLAGVVVVALVLASCVSDPADDRELLTIQDYLNGRSDAGEFIETESGLFYRILDEGDSGVFADTTDIIVSEVLLQGLDEKLYYSSDQAGPWHRKLQVSLILTAGMLEAYQLIPVGGEIEAIIPYPLGYGEEGFENGDVEPFENLRLIAKHLYIKLTPEEYIVQDSLGEFQDGGSGLLYQIDSLNQGEGEFPVNGSIVEIEYTGRFFDGEVFDRSPSGVPFEMTVGANVVIEGWELGIPLFKKGAEGILLIPYELAYGENGTPDGSIPPYEPLRFDIKIVDIR